MDALTTADGEQLLDTRHAHVHGQPYGSRHAVGCKASASWYAVRRVSAHRDGGLSNDCIYVVHDSSRAARAKVSAAQQLHAGGNE